MKELLVMGAAVVVLVIIFLAMALMRSAAQQDEAGDQLLRDAQLGPESRRVFEETEPDDDDRA